MAQLVAFGFSPGETNMHVIGDAYSDYQGFIEGALRSTARVISFFVNGEAGTEFSDRVFLSTNALRRDPVFNR
jgi:hypothetical protein